MYRATVYHVSLPIVACIVQQCVMWICFLAVLDTPTVTVTTDSSRELTVSWTVSLELETSLEGWGVVDYS